MQNEIGDFTLIGQTHAITFPARIILNHNNLAVEAIFKLDHKKWGMTHAADPALKNRHILPEVDIHLILAGTMKAGYSGKNIVKDKKYTSFRNYYTFWHFEYVIQWKFLSVAKAAYTGKLKILYNLG